MAIVIVLCLAPMWGLPRSTCRLWVLVVMLIAVVAMVAVGHSPDIAVAVVGGGGLAAAEVAARLLGPVPCRTQ
jgi:hypothetical protein